MIEQAKGVIMEQEGCTSEQAFDVLRKASQRSNVPVRELAVLSWQAVPPELDLQLAGQRGMTGQFPS